VNTPEWPTKLQINAFTGEAAAEAGPATDAKDWVLRSGPPKLRTFLKPDKPPDPTNWRDARVGWGLVLPHNPNLTAADTAAGKDAPPVLQALVAERGADGTAAPVYRYMPSTAHRGFLRRDGADIPISMAPKGTQPGAIARYLLIYGSPQEIPWEVQYQLNAVCAVGRLTLTGDALEHYVTAMQAGWKDAAASADAAVVWSVDHGPDDITNLMRLAIAERVVEKLRGDAQLQPKLEYLNGSVAGSATAAKLGAALAARKPGLVVTTSHGQTGPLDNVPKMAENLGLLVDEDRALVTPAALLAGWQPAGAIWYAHACCSAGSDAQTIFDGLVDKDSPIDRVLKGVASVGARVAPLPEALLGAKAPLRAFIGHVEPTFDWTLRQRFTGQFQTAEIERALYDRLYQPEPVGLAFRDYYGMLGGIYADYDQELRRFNKGEDNESRMLYHLLLARDVQSMVMLGDPTAMLPPLP
jgi:hypothetical protein